MRVKELTDIAYHYIPTKHALDRLQERFGTTDRHKIKMAILNSTMSYKNTDDTINIAINDWEYFVVTYGEGTEPIMITFKTKSDNDVSVYEKYAMARKGVERKL
jgi:hypothetical protein